ncbi:MAG: hypothetical protein FD126_3109 [Elusimicrobia bacterium]|nr:MAG: hypothetical protein FD126_3109 [Elusimicrobiota bacterium]
MRALAALLAVLTAVPAQAGSAVRPVVAPTLPGAGLPTAVIAPKLSLTPAFASPVIPQASLVQPTVLPAVAIPRPAALAAPAGPAPTFAAAASSLFDGLATRPAGSVSAVAMPARNGISQLGPSAFRGDLQGDQGAVSEPGSVFGWRAWDKAPTHGLPFVDRWVARNFGHTADNPGPGFEFRGARRRSDARAFLYGEKHSDKALVARNMAALARDMDPVRGGMVLVEGYLGPELFGTEAVLFLERRGLNADLLAERGVDFSAVRVRGWDDVEAHDASTPLVLRHHMELLALNSLTHDGKGLLYYPRLLKQAWRTFAAYVTMRKSALGGRNVALDRSLAAALDSSKETGRTVHVVAGSEHLLQKPDWLSAPLGAYRIRRALAVTLSGVPYWAEKPADTKN